MAPLRTLAALALCAGSASAFVPAKSFTTQQAAVVSRATPIVPLNAVADDWNAENPGLSKWGFGPSVHAEKWNGRHAMFGWLFIVATAYAKGHGLIPDADTMLTYKEWGPLAIISGKQYITNERAIILAAQMHVFFVGLLNTICPFPYGDPFVLDPNHPRYEKAMERNNSPFGFMPAFKTGLTEEAEMINGRLAMVGLTAVALDTFITGESFLDLTNKMFGGILY